MTLEFITEPNIKKGHKIKRFVTELMLSPDRWAKAYETPLCRKSETDYASKLVYLRNHYPNIEWEKAVDGEVLLIVARYNRGVS